MLIHWVCRQPTPYNQTLFRALDSDVDTELLVHFRDPVVESHPWRSSLTEGFPSRVCAPVAGVDWDLLRCARSADALFVVAGWDGTVCTSLLGALALRRRKFAVWTDTPDLSKRRRVGFRQVRAGWLKWVFSRATAVLATGAPGVAAIQAMGAPSTRTVNFPFVVDLSGYAPNDRERTWNGILRFVSAGRLDLRAKGHDIAIRALFAASRRTGRGFEYYVAGAGPDEAALRSLAGALGVAEHVHFTGWLEAMELRRLLASADVMVHPSPTHDPFPTAVLEGMAAGLPVLGSDCSGSVTDRVVDGEGGLIHRGGDAAQLEAQVAGLMLDPARVRVMGARARAVAESWPAERSVAIIRDLASAVHGRTSSDDSR